MRFIEYAGKGANKPVYYVATIALVILGYLSIGQLPITIYYMIEQAKTGRVMENVNQIMEALGFNTFLLLAFFPFVVCMACLWIGVKYIHKRTFYPFFTSRSKFDWKRVILSFGTWLFISGIMLGGLKFLGAPIHFQYNGSKFFVLLLISMTLLPVQTTFEEVLFRGYILQGLYSGTKKVGLSILISSFLFGLLHMGNPEVHKIGSVLLIYYIMSGVFMGVLSAMDEGLELSIGYHTANNFFAVVLLTNDWQVFRTDALFIDKSPASFGWESIMTILVLQPLLLVFFSKIYKWGKWSQKMK